MTSLRRPEHISKKISFLWYLWDVSKHLSQVFVIFQKYSTKIVSCDFPRVTETFDKIDVGLLKTLRKRNVFWEQCMVNNQVCHEFQLADIWMRILAS